jgi:hypothetical protein
MKAKEFEKFLYRDFGCIHCGDVEAVSPHHRLNRGMGGSKLRDNPANIIVLCSSLNSVLESDPKSAERARNLGWKLRSGQDSREVAVYYPKYRSWYRLDDEYKRELVSDSPVTAIEKLGF